MEDNSNLQNNNQQSEDFKFLEDITPLDIEDLDANFKDSFAVHENDPINKKPKLPTVTKRKTTTRTKKTEENPVPQFSQPEETNDFWKMPLPQTAINYFAKMTDKDKKEKDFPQKKKLLKRLKRYHTNYPKIKQNKAISIKSSLVEIEEALEEVEDQLSDGPQFAVGKMAFINGMGLIHTLNKFTGNHLILDGKIELKQAVTQRYEVFEPTVNELIIKYDLFKTGPELRLLMLVAQVVTEVDGVNRSSFEEEITKNIPVTKEFKKKFENL